MIVLIGESGSGKSSIAKVLVEKYGYKRIVSYTTRPPRKGERDGIDYFFITESKFQELKGCRFFAETGSYNGWNYGTAMDDCADSADKKIAIVTPYGMRQLYRSICFGMRIDTFYIHVPRRDRLIKLLQRGDNIEEAYRRNLSDVGQFDGIEDEVRKGHIIFNNGYEKTPEQITEEILTKIDLDRW